MRHQSETFVGGRWRPATGHELITVVDPSTEQCLATVRESSEEDVDAAVAAALEGSAALRRLAPEERASILLRLADELEARSDALVEAITGEMGMPRRLCLDWQVRSGISTFRTTVEALREVTFEREVGHSTVFREPVGVVAAITPWNYPLLQTASKLAPAIAAGCSVVLKPSELAPLDALLLAEAVEAAAMPPGVVNLVMGTGPHTGEYLVRHPDVSMVSLTGSTRAGRRVAALAAAGVKRVSLELGGKSPSIVLDDGDLLAAVAHSVASVLTNTGQTCTALTRLLVPFQMMSVAEEMAEAAAARYKVGSAHDDASDIGPLANANQLQRVRDHLERAPLDGARTVWQYPQDLLPDQGFFVPPTVYTVTDHRIPVARQEVFGPVLTIVPYVDESDAVDIANSTQYGLAAAVWSVDLERAVGVARRVESGTVDVNGAPFNSLAPFGGRRQSGLGRELGVHGIEEFTELKAVQHQVGAGTRESASVAVGVSP